MRSTFFGGRKHANIGSHFVAPPSLFIGPNFKFLCRIEGERDLSFLSPSACLFRRDFLDIFVKKTETENDKTCPPPKTLCASIYRSVGALLTNRFDIKIYREMQPDLFRTVAKKEHWVKTFYSLPTERYPFFNPPKKGT